MILYRFYHLKILHALSWTHLLHQKMLQKWNHAVTVLFGINGRFEKFVKITICTSINIVKQIKQTSKYQSSTRDRTDRGPLWHIHTLMQYYSASVLSTSIFLSFTLNNAIQNGQTCIELESSTLWKGLSVGLPSPLESACVRTSGV